MTKAILIFFGIIVIAFGFLSIVPALKIGPVPLWFGLLEVAVGLIAAIAGLMAKKPQ